MLRVCVGYVELAKGLRRGYGVGVLRWRRGCVGQAGGWFTDELNACSRHGAESAVQVREASVAGEHFVSSVSPGGVVEMVGQAGWDGGGGAEAEGGSGCDEGGAGSGWSACR